MGELFDFVSCLLPAQFCFIAGSVLLHCWLTGLDDDVIAHERGVQGVWDESPVAIQEV